MSQLFLSWISYFSGGYITLKEEKCALISNVDWLTWSYIFTYNLSGFLYGDEKSEFVITQPFSNLSLQTSFFSYCAFETDLCKWAVDTFQHLQKGIQAKMWAIYYRLQSSGKIWQPWWKMSC